MVDNSNVAGAADPILGEIETRVVGMRYHDAKLTFGERVNLEREPGNGHDSNAICVENGRFDLVGRLPR